MNSLQKTLIHYQKKTRDFPPLENQEKDVSYDVESLFTNIPVKETVNYILDQIYVHKKLPQICYYRLIFKRLLMKLAYIYGKDSIERLVW